MIQRKSPSAVLSARQLLVLNQVVKGSRKRAQRTRLLLPGANKKAKSAAARLLADKLGRTLYRIDLSAVVSKYVGETERNLRRVFDRAEKRSAILFFDEADALFGKRTTVKAVRDRYANRELARLVQRIENYRGLLVLAVKRKDKVDPALLRKFHFILAINSKKSSRAATPKAAVASTPSLFPGVYVEEEPSGVRTIAGVTTSVTVFIGTAACGELLKPLRVQSLAEFDREFGGVVAGMELGYSIRQFFLNGGSEAWVVRIPDNPGDQDWRDGLSALDAVQLFNLLVLPGMNKPALVVTAVSCCEQRRAFLILDAPAEAKTPDQMRQRIQAGELTRSSNAAVYYPWTRIADPLNNGLPRLCPPSGAIAGLFARIDAQRGVWKAPAGTEATLTGVTDLEYQLSGRDNEPLSVQGVNCLRQFPPYGFVAWGARTLAGADVSASEFKYIPVRRLALFLEESLNRGTRWATFEPNDEPLWARLRLNVEVFLNYLFRQGAFQGATSRDAYFVKCGRETTTSADLNAGWVNIVVGFAALKPAEFTIIQLRQAAGRTAT